MRRTKDRVFDEYLAASARAGDRRAFERLAARWQPKLLAHASRLTGDIEMGRDAAQDGWGDIVKGLPRLNDAALFPAWAYRIVTRRAVDAVRRKARTRKLNAAYAAEHAEASQPADDIETAADRAPLNRALRDLPPEQRVVIALHYREGFSVAEIAAALETPAGTVKTRLMHARRKLSAALKGGTQDE